MEIFSDQRGGRRAPAHALFWSNTAIVRAVTVLNLPLPLPLPPKPRMPPPKLTPQFCEGRELGEVRWPHLAYAPILVGLLQPCTITVLSAETSVLNNHNQVELPAQGPGTGSGVAGLQLNLADLLAAVTRKGLEHYNLVNCS